MEEGTPSTTARVVAQVRATMERPVTADGDGDIERRIVARFSPTGRSSMAEALERRTRWFDGVTLRSIEGGITQVVIVAAGYDCRALRFRTPGVRFFELDHPATQADKRAVLEALEADTDGIAFVAADFTRDDVAVALDSAGHDARLPTLFLVEGLLIYLDVPVIETLLRALRSRASEGSRMAVSMSRPQSPAFYARVAAAGEQAHSTFDEVTAAALLDRCGWTGDTSRTVVLATPLV